MNLWIYYVSNCDVNPLIHQQKQLTVTISGIHLNGIHPEFQNRWGSVNYCMSHYLS